MIESRMHHILNYCKSSNNTVHVPCNYFLISYYCIHVAYESDGRVVEHNLDVEKIKILSKEAC